MPRHQQSARLEEGGGVAQQEKLPSFQTPASKAAPSQEDDSLPSGAFMGSLVHSFLTAATQVPTTIYQKTSGDRSLS